MPRHPFAVAILLLTLLATTSIACHKQDTEEESVEIPPVPVVAEKPTVGTIIRWHQTTCELVSPLETSLAFPVGGEVIELVVNEGDTVTAGDYLGNVDTASLEASYNALLSAIEVARSQANAADIQADAVSSQADAVSSQVEAAVLTVDAAETGVEQARVVADQAEADYNRFVILYEDDVATESELEQAQLRWETAELTHEGALEQLESARAQVDAARAQASAARAQVDAARAQASAAYIGIDATTSQAEQILVVIEDGSLYAPFSGRIAERMAEPGTVVGPGQPIFRLIADASETDNKLEVHLEIPESLFGLVSEGSPLFIELEVGDFETVVDHLGPEVLGGSRAIEVLAYLEMDSRHLLPGMFGTVRIPLERHDNAILIPEDAILDFEEADYVFVADGNTAERREVLTGLYEDGIVEILEGISESDEVIIVGNAFLDDGASIELRELDLSDANDSDTEPRASASGQQEDGE